MPDFGVDRYRPDTYPGERPVSSEAHPADAFIHRNILKMIASRQPGESTGQNHDQVSRRINDFFHEAHDLGIDWQRIRVGSAIAQMDINQGRLPALDIAPEEPHAEA
jgi:hypothetical protein